MRLRLAATILASFALLGPAASAWAAEPPAANLDTPELYRQLVACKDIGDAAARLACYDRQVAAFDAATQSRDIVIADREEVRQARRGLFGFAAPVGRLFGFGSDGDGGAQDRDEITSLETKVARVGRGQSGWRLTFDEGGTWEQIDTRGWVMSPRAGQAAVISKGALGSYFVSVDGQRGIKMRRVE